MAALPRTVRRMLICLIASFAICMTVLPMIRFDHTTTVWAKSTSKSKSKKESTSKKKKTVKKNGFVKENGKWYYLIDGKKQRGWITVGKRVYYGKPDSPNRGMLLKGIQTIDGKEYAFRTEGKRKVVCSQILAGTTGKVNGIAVQTNEDNTFAGCANAGSRNGFVNKIGEMARENQARHNILASLVVAQACVETGYGAHVPGNNLFGIFEGSSLKVFRSWAACLEGYNAFMRRYIPHIFGVRNAMSACHIIGRAGYAAAGNYETVLKSIVASQNLTRFNR